MFNLNKSQSAAVTRCLGGSGIHLLSGAQIPLFSEQIPATESYIQGTSQLYELLETEVI